MPVEYLELSHVIAMHRVLIEKYGGLAGIRDGGLLESALAQPQQTAFGEELFPDIFSKTSAYAFYLSENQPFLDGNKRIATAAALTFLRLNGYDLKVPEKALYETIMNLANKRLSREGLAQWFKKFSVKKRKTRNKK